MKVLLVNKFFHIRGGAERVMYDERRRLLNEGVEVVDFAMSHPDNLPSPYSDSFTSHVDYHAPATPWTRLRHALSFIHSREAVRGVARLCRRHRPDMAHLHNIYHQLTPAIIPALKEANVPVALTLHDFKLACPVYRMLDGRGRPCERCSGRHFRHAVLHNCGDGLHRSALLAVESWWHRLRGSYGHVDLFIAPSRFMADVALKAGVRPERIRVLPNGVALPEDNAAHDGGYALYLGRLSPEKGLRTLLRAQAMVPRVPLRVAGTGPLEDALRAEAPQVSFLGHLGPEALQEQLRGASMVVVPSEYYENCSMALLEAMAMGKAVIATDIGGIPEQITHGRDGMLFPPGDAEALRDALTRLLNDPDLRGALGRKARATIRERFSLDAHCRGLLDIYAQLAGNPP